MSIKLRGIKVQYVELILTANVGTILCIVALDFSDEATHDGAYANWCTA